MGVISSFMIFAAISVPGRVEHRHRPHKYCFHLTAVQTVCITPQPSSPHPSLHGSGPSAGLPGVHPQPRDSQVLAEPLHSGLGRQRPKELHKGTSPGVPPPPWHLPPALANGFLLEQPRGLSPKLPQCPHLVRPSLWSLHLPSLLPPEPNLQDTTAANTEEASSNTVFLLLHDK